MAIEGRDLQESIQSLQQELLIGGEVQERYRQRVNSLLRHVQQSSEESLLLESSSHQICGNYLFIYVKYSNLVQETIICYANINML